MSRDQQEKATRMPFGLSFLYGFLPENHRDDITGDLEEQYEELCDTRGKFVADLWLLMQIPLNLIAALNHKIFWSLVHFRDDLRLAWRHVRRNRIQTLTNVAGLLVGLTCSLVIILYTVNELSYDRHHPFADRLYRVITYSRYGDRINLLAMTSPPVGPRIRENYPQAELVAVVVAPYENSDHVFIQVGEDTYFNSSTWFAEPQLLDIMDIPLLRGSKKDALRDPNTVLLSESWAKKLFGNLDVVGKTMTIELDYEYAAPREEFLITGVVKDSPIHTHLKGDIWVSHSTLEQKFPNLFDNWFSHRQRYTYVRLHEGADPVEFESALREIAAEFGQAEPLEGEPPTERSSRMVLQPVTDIHMGLPCRMNPEPMGNMTYIYIYATVALLVLIVACMNFVHLAATLSSKRSHEFSVRRAFGALRKHLNGQLLAESVLVTLLALAGSILLMQIVLPVFNGFSGRELTLAGLLHPAVLAVLVGLVALVVLGAGVLPAAAHTVSKPIELLHGRPGGGSGRMPGQRIFIVMQLTVLTFLLICTFAVQYQLDFMKGQALGFEMDHKVVMKVKSDMPGFHHRYESVQEAFAANPDVLNASVSSSVPGEQWGAFGVRRVDRPEADLLFSRVFTVDPYFSEVFGLELLEGSLFDADKSEEENYGYIINQTLLNELGYASPSEAIGQQVWAHYHGRVKPILGVIRDFHIAGMQEEIRPLLLDIEKSLMSTITVTLPGGRIQEGMEQLRGTWAEQFPGVPFEYRFLDEVFDTQYRYEKQAGDLLAIVTLITILIAITGLVGLVYSMVQQRRPEIGIRKVLGASQMDILRTLSGGYLLLVLISAAIAVPLGWWIMHLWLKNFAYRITQTVWLPLWAVIVVLVLTGGMLFLQGFRVARINPATAIRDE